MSFLNVQHSCFLPGPLLLLLFDSKAQKILAFGQRLRSHTQTLAVSLCLMESRPWGLVNICFHRVVPQIPGAPRGWLCPRGTQQHWTCLWNHNRFHQHEGHWLMGANTPAGICSTILVPPNWIKQLWNRGEERRGLSRANRGRRDLHFRCLVLKLFVLTQERGQFHLSRGSEAQ